MGVWHVNVFAKPVRWNIRKRDIQNGLERIIKFLVWWYKCSLDWSCQAWDTEKTLVVKIVLREINKGVDKINGLL